MIRVGQTLWGINRITNEEDMVRVVATETDYFVVEYNGAFGRYRYDALNTKFFAEPQRDKPKRCSDCFLKLSGECTSLSGTICEDFRPRQVIAKEETDSWPEYGDATALRIRDYKHFK